ncbi:MAG: WYL domain-containing protein [Gemmatimonadota bacterium]
MTSSEQVNRIVSLVAHLATQARQGSESAPLDDVAQRFNATRSEIQSDIRALTLLGDNPDADWALSLSVWQESDRISITSGGPFQRPIRFTGDELVAIQLGLAEVTSSHESLSADLAGILNTASPVSHALAGRGRVSPSIRNLVKSAIGDRRRLEVKYTSERTLGGLNRIIHPYQLLERGGHTYIIAWCELADGWRRFRLDRVLDALSADGHYVPRPDFVPADESFAPPAEGTTPVDVRFSPAVARWLREGHPGARTEKDGGIVVTYQVASPDWLVRHVLQYGPEAEVIGPQSFRELMRKELQ